MSPAGRVREFAATAAGWALSLGVAFVVWELITRAADSFFFPRPTAVFPHLWTDAQGFGQPAFFSTSISDLFMGPGFTEDIVPSLSRMFRGLVLAAIFGVGIGVALGLSRRAREYTAWIVDFVRAIPPPALLGIWLVVFGIGDGPKVNLIAFAVVWPILLNTIDGVAAVDEQRLQAARVFRIPFHRQLTGIYLPSAAPKILSGLRISLGFALIMMIISEFAGATNGLGLRLQDDLKFFNYVDMWATMVVLAGLGLLFNAIFVVAENRIVRWQRESTRISE